MNKKGFIIFISVILLLAAIGLVYYFYTKNINSNKNNNEYEATRTSTEDNEQENATNNNTDSNNSKQEPKIIETTISTFSTKIYSTDSARQNNVNITCNTLNDTIVKNGETFSFCDTIGQASTSKGYQKADIFDRNGNKKKGLGRRKLPSK